MFSLMPQRRSADTSVMECASCRADLDATDRYCPACRAPNMAGTRHPRFGPPERDPGPIVAPRVIAAGSRPCPRCHDGIRPRDVYCRSCGLDVSLLAPLPPRDRTVGVWTTPGPQGIDAYRPLGRLTRVLQALVVLSALIGAVLAAVSVLLWRKLGGGSLPNIEVSSTSLSWADLHRWGVRLAVAQLAVLAVASILTVVWTRRAYRNLSGLDVQTKRLPAVWATLGWFVPGVNLVMPKVIVDSTWRESDPRAGGRRQWGRQPIPTTNHLWWICTLVALPTMALALIEVADLGSTPPILLGDLHADQAALVLLAVAEALLVFAAMLFVRTLASINDRQLRRALRLGPPAALSGMRDTPAAPTPPTEDVTGDDSAGPTLDLVDPDDPWAFPEGPWPEAEPALAHLGNVDDRSGRY